MNEIPFCDMDLLFNLKYQMNCDEYLWKFNLKCMDLETIYELIDQLGNTTAIGNDTIPRKILRIERKNWEYM